MTEKLYVKQWTSSVEYYDMEDGIQITKHQATRKTNGKPDYIIVKTDKITTLNQLKTKGHVTHYKQCRKQPQRKLFN